MMLPLCPAAEMKLTTTGNILGVVQDAAGNGQMGAVVWLLNRYERPVLRAVTNDKGQFGFDQLAPDVYSIKVTLASFVPAFKGNILVEAGRASFLNVHVASLLSSVELFYSGPGTAKLMSDEWRWVLRSSLSTRPVLRFLPGFDAANGQQPGREASTTSVFSGTRGMVRVSAGDSAGTSGYANQQDLGTAFAMATSLFGTNQVGVSGNVGYSLATGIPTAGFRTSYRHGDSTSMAPEVNLTVRQLFLPNRVGGGMLSGSSNVPALRTMSVSVAQKQQVLEDLLFEYGFSLDSVAFIERLNYVSPYARLTYDLGNWGAIEMGYSSGAPPVELLSQTGIAAKERVGNDLSQNLSALGMFPRVSLRGGVAQVQRTQNYELGYRKVDGNTTYSLAAYREAVGNAALTIAGAVGALPMSDLLPDLNSNSSVFNIGNFRRTGFSGTVEHAFFPNLTASVSVGRNGVLRTEARELLTDDPGELRALVRRTQRTFATVRVSGTVPKLGTQLTSSYQWTDYRSLTPGHLYLTQRGLPDAGLNLSVRQPVPGMLGMPGRMEIHAEARNMLAQGYLGLDTPAGRRMLLIHTPRALRGGVSFFF